MIVPDPYYRGFAIAGQGAGASALGGVSIVPPGRRLQILETAMSRWFDLGFADRMLPFDSAAVVRKKDARWGEVPVAFAARTDEALTGEDVIGLCRGRIANYKLPKEVHFVAMEGLPRSTSGKIQRHVLDAQLG